MALIWQKNIMHQKQNSIKNLVKKYFNLGDSFVNNYTNLKPILVLDLDETLVHYDFPNELLYFRPGLDVFLKELYKLFRICVFTAGTAEHAHRTVNAINEFCDFKDGEAIQYVLDRNFMSEYNENGQVFKIKNLLNVNEYILSKSLYGTQLSPLQKYKAIIKSIHKTIIIDNIQNNYINYINNGINISDFLGDDENDIALYLIKNFLIKYSEDVNLKDINASTFIINHSHIIKNVTGPQVTINIDFNYI